MIRKIIILAFAAIYTPTLFAQNGEYLEYIDKYKKIAVKEMDRAGIPASIKLAQALLESNAGKSDLARKANNHFGIKCGAAWKGKTYHKEDDDYDEFGDLQKSCFRKYRSVEDSYIAHSEFLRDPQKANRYGFLFRLKSTDYKRWAYGLRTSGYATGANYDDKLIRIIETYKLYEFDRLTDENFPEGRPEKPEDAIAGLDLRKINDVKVVFAANNITVQDISLKTGISLARLERYNENLPAPNDTLTEGTRVYLQPKRCSYRGHRKWHYVRQGETLFDISQLYGVKLARLQKVNRIPVNAQPQADERIKLKGCKVKENERPRLLDEPKPTATVPPLREGDDGFLEEDITPEKPTTTQPEKPTTTQPEKPTTTQTQKPTMTQPEKPTTTQPEKPTTTQPDVKPTQPSGAVTHTVVKGDTLYNISKRYGITVDELKRLNNLADNTIKIGQVLRVK
jgi:flagellum-specific peptidoglycan hydrolase FlgJ